MPLCAKDSAAVNATQTLTFKYFKKSIADYENLFTHQLFGSITYSTTTTTNYDDFTTADFGSVKERIFLITDHSGGSSGNFRFDLTLLPATIGMTVSTSTAGTSYSSGGTNISSTYSSSYNQLKYNQQINFSCDNTTRMAVYSSARNDTSPFYKDLSASNNYSSNQILKNWCLYVFICFY